MANPYEWSERRERRYDEHEQDAGRSASRYGEQEPSWDEERGRRQEGGYASGWHGQDPDDDRARSDRYGRGEGAGSRVGEGLERGWRRLSQGVREAFDERRPGPYGDTDRPGGGMFGGQDRRDSLFSHDERAAAQRVGPHRGKGPKGYVRSDARILEDVSDRLADDGRLDASDIEVKVQGGEVTLNGQVRSREDKRRAEDIAEQASGVKHLQNNLRVKPPEARPEQAGAAAPGAQYTTAQAASMSAGSIGGAVPNPRPQ